MKRLLPLLLVFNIGVADTTNNGSTTSSQSNTSGSNTSISGGYSAESTITYQSGSSSSQTTNNTTNNAGSKTAVNSAQAPALNSYSQESCVIPLSIGMTVIGFSTSMGTYYHDEDCSRRKTSAMLSRMGLKVAAISLLCQDVRVWRAMMMSNSPCPVDGLIGDKAKKRWEELGNEKYFDSVNATSSGKRRNHHNK